MTISFHLPGPASGRVVVASSPLLETLLSLHALDGRLEGRLGADLRELRFCFHGSIPDIAAARTGGGRRRCSRSWSDWPTSRPRRSAWPS